MLARVSLLSPLLLLALLIELTACIIVPISPLAKNPVSPSGAVKTRSNGRVFMERNDDSGGCLSNGLRTGKALLAVAPSAAVMTASAADDQAARPTRRRLMPVSC